MITVDLTQALEILLRFVISAYREWNNLWASILTSDVGEWLRTLAAAVLGGALGGFFTLRGQARAETAQAKRDALARSHAVSDAQRAETLRDARELYEDFVHLQGEVLAAPVPFNVLLGAPWIDTWKGIWSPSLRDKLRVGTFVLPDTKLRDDLLELIWFLSRAPDYSNEGFPYPGKPSYPLPKLVEALAAEGVEMIAAYLRGDQDFATRRSAYWRTLRRARKDYDEWEKYEVAESIKRDEAAAEAEAGTETIEGGNDAGSVKV